VLCGLLVPVTGCGAAPVEVDQPGMSDRARAACADLVAALPGSVAEQGRRETDPDDALGAAWGDPAIVLTCGVGRPDDYDPANGCTTVDAVDWYIPMEQLEANGEQDLTMTTIGREPAVRVVLPGSYWPPATPLADLSRPLVEHTERTGRCV
jgi:hypothetical protein